jgi:catechol 2,3-dioxygenase-like lactoylglutathione lyase family enzyme
MSSVQDPRELTADGAGGLTTDLKMEVVVIPVSDVDRARDFYAGLGWRLDADVARDGFRLIQITPPGSSCSIQFGTDLTSAAPGSANGLYLIDGSFASFTDPDGNGWLLQEITTRLPGRVDAAATSFASADDLSKALQRAAAAHGQHEARIGREDPDWPDWYAEYMVREQAGEELPS